MAVKARSFWSTTSGVFTGIAGTLTGVVALASLATQQGWLGSSGSGDSTSSAQAVTTTTVDASSSTTPALGGASGSSTRSTAGSSSGQTTDVAPLRVTPQSVSFDVLGTRTATVDVVNTGATPVAVQAPLLEGTDADKFTVTAPSCTAAMLDPGRSCEVHVRFTPPRSGSYKGKLVISGAGIPAREVPLTGSALL